MTTTPSRLTDVIKYLEESGHSFPDKLKIDPHPMSGLKLYLCEGCHGVLEHWVSTDTVALTPLLRRECKRV